MNQFAKKLGVISAFFSSVALQACVGPVEAEDSAPVPSWEMVWFDEFDSDTLDRTKWSVEESCWGGGNNERQCYTDREDNVSVEDGMLVLSAVPETFTGLMYPAHYEHLASDALGEKPYTSGKVISYGKADWKYGRISARIKLPKGQGPWAAFWLMPVESVYGNWPLSGEIDIMESVNLGTTCTDCTGGIERRTSGAVHFGDAMPNNTYLYFKTEREDLEVDPSEWGVYSVEWAEGVIQWFVDDQIVLRLDSDDWYTGSPDARDNAAAPFDQPFYLNLNLAVGGALAESKNAGGVDASVFPAEMKVDWVRVEQCAGDQDTGLACLSDQDWVGRPLGPSDNRAP